MGGEDKADALWVSAELEELQARTAALELLVRDLLSIQIATSKKMRVLVEDRAWMARRVADDRTTVQGIKFSTHYRYLELLQEHLRIAEEWAELEPP